MLGTFKNTKKQGDAGLGYAIAYFCSQGIPVCIPLTDSQDYDLVIEIDGILKKVQIKTTKHKNDSGNYAVGLQVTGGNSKRNFIHKRGDEIVYDWLFVVTGDLRMYFIPRVEFATYRRQLCLCEKWDRFLINPSQLEVDVGVEPTHDAFAAHSVPTSPIDQLILWTTDSEPS